MKKKTSILATLCLFTWFGIVAPAQQPTPAPPTSSPQSTSPQYGPAKCTLVIVGGGGTDGTGIMERFIELAGGPDKKFIIVPTAGGNRRQDGTLQEYKEEDIIQGWV